MVRITSNRYYDKKANTVICKRTVLGYYATRKEAMIALAKYNEDPYDLKTRDITFKEVYEMWKEHGMDGLSESSHRTYAAAYKYTKPIQNMPITKIRTDDMQNIIYSISHMSDSTIQGVIKIFHKTFRYAMQRDIIEKDYSSYIIGKSTAEKDTSIHKEFTSSEISLLWENLDRHVTTYYKKDPVDQTPADLFLIMIYTGMRPAELINMKTSDVHLDEHYMVGGVKNKQSKNRIIPIHDDIMEIVSNRYDSNNEYLVMYADNKPPDNKQFRQMTDAICSKLKIDHLPHDGRHTFATFAKRSKIDEFYIQKIMGHKPKGITNQVYTHVDPEELVAEANKIKFIK